MKKRIALILTIVMLAGILLPMQSLAAELDSGLQKAIGMVKAKFTVPDDFEFEPGFRIEGEKKIWYLRWFDKDYKKGSLEISIDEDGIIYNYYSYKPTEYPQTRKFPNVSKKEAREIAEKFIMKVNPSVMDNIEYIDNEGNVINNYDYNLNFIRKENGILYYSDSIRVTVNSETGDVENYRYSWTDGVSFPDPSTAITSEQAQEAYKEKLGLDLIYKYSYQNEKLRIYPVYTPRYENSSYVIDAFTGEKVQIGYNHYIALDGGMTIEKQNLAKTAGEIGGGISYSEEELKAIGELEEIISPEEAEAMLRDLDYLGLTSEHKMSSPRLNREWMFKDEYTWSMYFNKEATEENKTRSYVNVRMDAITGEIKSFSVNNYDADVKEQEAQFDMDACKTAVEEFLKENYGEKFAETEYNDLYTGYRTLDGEMQTYYNFNYVRKVNGISFPANGFTVGYDAVNGKITQLNMEWFKAEFPKLDDKISIDKAYDCLFSQVGIDKQYKIKYSDRVVTSREYVEPKIQTPEIILVYPLNPNLPVDFDALTGEWLDYSGRPYKKAEAISYTDISGHYAEDKITTLAEYGIGFEGTELRPDEDVTQKDFLSLLAKVLNYYYGPIITSESSDKDIDNMYSLLVREGVIKESEISPEAAVSREQCAVFLIRAMKFSEVADIKGIFDCKFNDADNISEESIGYVTLAYGLKLIGGDNLGNYNPQQNLSRVGAVLVIYNYLDR